MGEIRGLDSLVGTQGKVTDPSLNQFGHQISMPWVYNLALQGRVYIAGYGIEETDTDGTAAIDDTTPTFMLRAPDQGVVVMPLYFRVKLTTEGGAAPDAWLTHVSSATDTPIAYTSGTKITPVNALGGAQRDAQARCEHTCTIGAVSDAQNNVIWDTMNLLDDLISVEGATTVVGVDSVDNRMTAVTIPLYPHIPLCLARGSMLNFYAATATTDSKWRPTFVWAEVDETIVPAS